MHTDGNGVVHPITLKGETESADVHYASCDSCGARWAGPFSTPAMAQRVAELANDAHDYDLPNRCRVGATGPCCKDGVPIEVPGVTVPEGFEPAPPLRTQVLDTALGFGKATVIAAFLLWQVGRAVIGFVVGALRLLARLGWWSLGLLLGVAVLGNAVGGALPSASTVGLGLVGVLGVLVVGGLVVMLGRRVLADLRAPVVEGEPDYSTPLTTAPGGATVEHVSTTPADGKAQGVTGRAAGTRQP